MPHAAPCAPPRALVLATIVRLLDTTFVRVGNAQYARHNKSYGLTTLRNRHAGVDGDALKLRFRGKSGVMHAVELHDRRVATVVRCCRQMPGQELLQWQDDSGALHVVDSGDVNDDLAEAAGDAFTAKNFRTWHGTVLAQVARHLGNTPAVCRKAYVHPAVLDLGTRLAADPATLADFADTPAETLPARGARRAERGRAGLAAFLKTVQPKQRKKPGAVTSPTAAAARAPRRRHRRRCRRPSCP